MKSVHLILAACLLTAESLAADTASAHRVATPPRIDGRLDEPEWQLAPVATGFRQRDPNDGAPANQETEVRVLYDDQAVYVGARMHDADPLRFRLGRRDMAIPSSDWFRVSFDTFHDRRNAVRFDVNPAGVRRDANINGNYFLMGGFAGGDGELAWDPVWEARTSRDATGWTAELRIPLSQIRYTPNDDTWGVQFERIDDHLQELDQFAYTSKSRPGGVGTFGDLAGLRDLRRGRPFELVPFVLGQGKFDSTGTNPLVRRRDLTLKVGADARYGLTPNLSLAATLNPDFGQVEVDPAVINLTAFETRLDEKRPFFIEGSNAFRYANSSIGPFTAKELFYPRRLGRTPQVGLPSRPADIPSSVDLAAAAKLTGRTESGWTLGVLDAVSREMRGSYLDNTGFQRDGVVEPRTNYFVGRLNREMRAGQSAAGVILTAVSRDDSDPAVAATLARSAYTGGLDFNHEFDNRVWNLSGYLNGSQLKGSAAAIAGVQRSPARFYQRPDARSFSYNPSATSLSGSAGQIQLTKQTGTHWLLDGGYTFASPGYEINDLGFQQRVDRRGWFGRVSYNDRTTREVLRSWNVALLPELLKNYDGDWLEKNLRLMATLQHLNFWSLNLQAAYLGDRFDDRFTRGGPVARKPAGWNFQASLTSDPREKFTGTLTLARRPDRTGSRTDEISGTVDVRTGVRWNLSFGPRLTRTWQDAQYVATVADATAVVTSGNRYVFAPLNQTEASLVTRLNYAFTPDLTLELYSQALVSNGRYGAPKEFLQPREYRFGTYGTDLGTISRSGSNYTVDPDGTGPAAAFAVADRSFTSRSLRANAVLRWEYRPGSTLYVVWQQDRLNPLIQNDFAVIRSLSSLLNAKAKNVLAIKYSYWFSR